MPHLGGRAYSHGGPFMSPITPGSQACVGPILGEDVMMELPVAQQPLGFTVEAQSDYLPVLYPGPHLPLALPGGDARESAVSSLFCDSNAMTSDAPTSGADFTNLFADPATASWMGQSVAAPVCTEVCSAQPPASLSAPTHFASSDDLVDVPSNATVSTTAARESSVMAPQVSSTQVTSTVKPVAPSPQLSCLNSSNDFADSPSPSFCLEDLDARLSASRRETEGDGTEEVLRRINRLREASKLSGVNSYANGPALTEASKSSRTQEENRRCGKRKSAYISRFAAKEYQKLLENEIATAELECAVFKDSLERQRRTNEDLQNAIQSLSSQPVHQQL